MAAGETFLTRTKAARSRRISGAVRGKSARHRAGPVFFSRALGANDDHIGMGEERQGDVAIPSVIAADLVLIQPDFAFGLLEAGFDSPAATGDLDQFFEGGTDRGIRQVVSALPVTSAMAANQVAFDEPSSSSSTPSGSPKCSTT